MKQAFNPQELRSEEHDQTDSIGCCSNEQMGKEITE